MSNSLLSSAFAYFVIGTLGFSQLALAQAPTKSEAELIAVLQSDAPKAEKALVCKHLSVKGSKAAVPELAKLLADEQLASWCRTALEAIPGPEADEALRKATESLQGNLLVGAINSIGVRRDAQAVELLAGRLSSDDADVAAAAAVALGRIGNDDAAKALRPKLTGGPASIRSAVAEGCILCAERYLADGNAAEATKIYDEVRAADVPRPRMLEATRGAILARGKEGIPLLVEQLRSDDKGLFQIALSTAREFPGGDVDKALAAELEKAFPERAALIVTAMADRPQTVDLAAILKAAESGAGPLKLAAMSALGRVGDATALAPLLKTATGSDAELATAAKEALAAIEGEAVDREIAARLAKAEGSEQLVLIELVGQRHIQAIEPLLAATKSSDRAIRHAALKALGNTASEKYLPVLVKEAAGSTSPDDAAVAHSALRTAAMRMPDRDACAAAIATALDRAPLATKISLLETLAAVGGAKALEEVGAAANSNDPALQDAGSRLLGDWPSAEAAPVLLGLAKGTGKYQNRALRGYIGMSQRFVMSDQQRAQMCSTALTVARQPAEQKLVLDVLKKYPSVETLKQAVAAMQIAGIKDDAKAAAAAIAQKLQKTDEVRALMKQAGLAN